MTSHQKYRNHERHTYPLAISPQRRGEKLLILLNINNRALELASRNTAIEEDITLTIRSMLKLRQEEECHNPADHSRRAPDITALATKVPARLIEHLRREVDHGDLSDVVSGATDAGGEGAETDGGCLGDDGVGDGTEGAGEDEGDDDTEDGLGVVCRVVLRDRGDDAEEEKEEDVDGGAPEVDGAAAEPGGERPGDDVGDKLKAGVDQVELEGLAVADAGLCVIVSTGKRVEGGQGTYARRRK